MKKIQHLLLACILATAVSSCSKNGPETDRISEFAGDFSRGFVDGLKSAGDSTTEDLSEITLHLTGEEYDEFATTVITVSQDSVTGKRNVDANIHFNDIDTSYDDNNIEAVIAVSAGIGMCIIAILVPVLIVLTICIYMFRTRRDRNRVISAAIDKGYNLPAEFWTGPKANRTLRLQSAFVFLGWGIGILCFFSVFDSRGTLALAMLGLIPIIIGIGRLAAFLIQRRDMRAAQTDNTGNTGNATSDDQ